MPLPPITACCLELWEAISPDPILMPYEDDYRWLSQVYVSVQPTTGQGALLWHALGAKTIELIHQNIHVEAVRDDLDEIVLDADLLEAMLSTPDPEQESQRDRAQDRRSACASTWATRASASSPSGWKALKEQHDAGQLQQHRLS